MNAEDKFIHVRAAAAQAQLIVVRQDGRWLVLPALSKDKVTQQMLASVEGIIPSAIKRNLAVIADTTWAEKAATLQAANRAIPFFGILMGLSCIGHSVWIYDGSETHFEAGCNTADVLIVDSAKLATLPSNWDVRATKMMRTPEILIHDRANYRLRRLKEQPNADD